MAFDQGSTKPLVNLEKETTTVNISIVIAVLAFFVIAIFGGIWAWHRFGNTSQSQTTPIEEKTGTPTTPAGTNP